MTAVEPLVLIVDDDDQIRELLALGLEGNGFRTATAGNGFAGLRSALQHPPDVIVLDLMMPGRDGFTVLDGIRSRQEMTAIPIVMLTGRSGMHDLRRVMEAGADTVITKPFVFEHLVWQLREALQHAAHAATTSPRWQRPRSDLP